jgi:hypothetical protein
VRGRFHIVCAPSRSIDGGLLYGMGVWAIVFVLHLWMRWDLECVELRKVLFHRYGDLPSHRSKPSLGQRDTNKVLRMNLGVSLDQGIISTTCSISKFGVS